jgi:periplasmic copper chaperone A
MVNKNTAIPAAVVAGLALVVTAGCSAEPQELVVNQAWAKSAESGMTGVFAEISNPRDETVTVVGGFSEVSREIELHEVADGVMREKEEGFFIAARSSHTLEPGADHIMLMGLREALLPGDTLTVTLELDTGETLEVVADIRDFAGANEEYVPGHGGGEGSE